MSLSPPIRRLSNASCSSREELINAYEAEEERIINVLSRKLEQLKEEKVTMERHYEEESESHINRLSRELTALRLRQQQQQAGPSGVNGHSSSVTPSPEDGRPIANGQNGFSTAYAAAYAYGAEAGPNGSLPYLTDVLNPSADALIDTLKRENEGLRARLHAIESDYGRVTRLNEIYREELIEHRKKLGIPVDSLIGISQDPYSQPIHLRSSTTSSSPTGSMIAVQPPSSRASTSQLHGMPIPISHSNSMRRSKPTPLEPAMGLNATTNHSASSSASDSPFAISPLMSPSPVQSRGGGPESYTSNASYNSYLSNASVSTQLTTPPSSASLQWTPPAPYPLPPPTTLSYPSVPPPSLSSSLGSPVVNFTVSLPPANRENTPYQILGQGSAQAQFPPSPIDSFSPNQSRRPSIGQGIRRGSFSMGVRGRRESIERGGRIAETGSLLRNRDYNATQEASSSAAVPSTSASSDDLTQDGNTSSNGTSTDGH